MHTDEVPTQLRGLQSNKITKFICVPGIIVSTSKSTIKVKKAVWKCLHCGHEKTQEYEFGLQRVIAPDICENSKNQGDDKTRCPLRSYKLDLTKSEYFDSQRMKLQEAPENIPTGEMPRSVEVYVDRYLADSCTPGNRVKLTGVFKITKTFNSNNDASTNKRMTNKVQKPYIRVLGI